MGDGTPNEYYAITKWQIEALRNTVNGLKIEADTKFSILAILENLDELTTASIVFYFENKKELYELSTRIKNLEAR